MPERHLRFLTSNAFKIKEAQRILASAGIHVTPLEHRIEELQTSDEQRLVRDKALRAFDVARAPVFVEHTGLHLAHLRGLPGGLTQVFWDTLEAERFADLFGTTPDPSATARTTIGYVDGQRIRLFTGEVEGRIINPPRGPRDFQWDCVFQPNGTDVTFAEMGSDKKNEISMRRVALDTFAESLRDEL